MLACGLSLAVSGTVLATTDECNQDPVYPDDAEPFALGYAAGDCSLDGNGSLALIGQFGAPDLDPEVVSENVGRALVYHYTSGAWSEVQKLQHSFPEPGDWFGTSVAVSGRFAIIAAPRRGLDDEGAIFFFERDVLEPAGSQWSQFSEIANPSGEDDGFGGTDQQHETVAIDGSIAVVGAYLAHGGTSTASGRVYVYVFDVIENEWVYEATLKPPSPDDTQACGFGYAVEISGNRVIVGAPTFKAGSSSQYTDAGKAYVFTRTGTGSTAWSLEGQLVSNSSDPSNERLGWSVSIDGNAALVGAPGTPQVPSRATVFAYSSSTWSLYENLTPSEQETAGFGFAVALSSTLALVGSPFADTSGRAYLFQRTSGSWDELLILRSTRGPSFTDQVGATLALRGTSGIVGALGTSQGLVPKVGAVLFFPDLPDPDCE